VSRVAGGIAAPGSLGSRRDSLPSPGSSDQPYNVFDAALPFGGFKESGWGREMGRDVLDNYLETKSVCVKL
jgi:hypothetical protein